MGLVLDQDNFTAVVDGKPPVDLTRREWDILVYLIENNERVISKEELIHNVFTKAVGLNSVEVYVKYLRHKIGDQYIVTRRGFGYRIELGA